MSALLKYGGEKMNENLSKLLYKKICLGEIVLEMKEYKSATSIVSSGVNSTK